MSLYSIQVVLDLFLPSAYFEVSQECTAHPCWPCTSFAHLSAIWNGAILCFEETVREDQLGVPGAANCLPVILPGRPQTSWSLLSGSQGWQFYYLFYSFISGFLAVQSQGCSQSCPEPPHPQPVCSWVTGPAQHLPSLTHLCQETVIGFFALKPCLKCWRVWNLVFPRIRSCTFTVLTAETSLGLQDLNILITCHRESQGEAPLTQLYRWGILWLWFKGLLTSPEEKCDTSVRRLETLWCQGLVWQVLPSSPLTADKETKGTFSVLVLAMEMTRAVLSTLSPIHSPVSKERVVFQDPSMPKMRKVACLQSLHVGFHQVKQCWRWLPVAIFHLPTSFQANLMCPRSLNIVRARAVSLREDFLGEWPHIDSVMKAFASSQLLPI